MKFALYDKTTRAVCQWQDDELFGYAEPADTQGRLQLPEGFAFPSEMRWVVNGALTTAEPTVQTPTPVPSVPAQVTMRQARLALLAAGILSAVDAAIASLPNPDRDAAQIEWDYSAYVERNSPVVLLLGTALGLDEDALDALFVEAQSL